MWQIGVWERDEGLAERISCLSEGKPSPDPGLSSPGAAVGLDLDLLIVSPRRYRMGRGRCPAVSHSPPPRWAVRHYPLPSC